MGWQVYGTNAVALALTQVVWAYRGQYRIEDDWSRLKGRSLGLTPLYLQDEERIGGLGGPLGVCVRLPHRGGVGASGPRPRGGRPLRGGSRPHPPPPTDRPPPSPLARA